MFNIILASKPRCREKKLGIMARSLRIDVPDGWYHVLNRGVERRQIFPDEGSNAHFLELLGCLPSRFEVRIYGYVLMGNHCQLQLQTPKPI